MTERLALRPKEAARSLGVGLTTFNAWVAAGRMPRPVKVGRVVLFDATEIEQAWLAMQGKPPALGHQQNPYD
jgi:excisionase family DNA binding protein